MSGKAARRISPSRKNLRKPKPSSPARSIPRSVSQSASPDKQHGSRSKSSKNSENATMSADEDSKQEKKINRKFSYHEAGEDLSSVDAPSVPTRSVPAQSVSATISEGAAQGLNEDAAQGLSADDDDTDIDIDLGNLPPSSKLPRRSRHSRYSRRKHRYADNGNRNTNSPSPTTSLPPSASPKPQKKQPAAREEKFEHDEKCKHFYKIINGEAKFKQSIDDRKSNYLCSINFQKLKEGMRTFGDGILRTKKQYQHDDWEAAISNPANTVVKAMNKMRQCHKLMKDDKDNYNRFGSLPITTKEKQAEKNKRRQTGKKKTGQKKTEQKKTKQKKTPANKQVKPARRSARLRKQNKKKQNKKKQNEKKQNEKKQKKRNRDKDEIDNDDDNDDDNDNDDGNEANDEANDEGDEDGDKANDDGDEANDEHENDNDEDENGDKENSMYLLGSFLKPSKQDTGYKEGAMALNTVFNSILDGLLFTRGANGLTKSEYNYVFNAGDFHTKIINCAIKPIMITPNERISRMVEMSKSPKICFLHHILSRSRIRLIYNEYIRRLNICTIEDENKENNNNDNSNKNGKSKDNDDSNRDKDKENNNSNKNGKRKDKQNKNVKSKDNDNNNMQEESDDDEAEEESDDDAHQWFDNTMVTEELDYFSWKDCKQVENDENYEDPEFQAVIEKHDRVLYNNKTIEELTQLNDDELEDLFTTAASRFWSRFMKQRFGKILSNVIVPYSEEDIKYYMVDDAILKLNSQNHWDFSVSAAKLKADSSNKGSRFLSDMNFVAHQIFLPLMKQLCPFRYTKFIKYDARCSKKWSQIWVKFINATIKMFEARGHSDEIYQPRAGRDDPTSEQFAAMMNYVKNIMSRYGLARSIAKSSLTGLLTFNIIANEWESDKDILKVFDDIATNPMVGWAQVASDFSFIWDNALEGYEPHEGDDTAAFTFKFKNGPVAMDSWFRTYLNSELIGPKTTLDSVLHYFMKCVSWREILFFYIFKAQATSVISTFAKTRGNVMDKRMVLANRGKQQWKNLLPITNVEIPLYVFLFGRNGSKTVVHLQQPLQYESDSKSNDAESFIMAQVISRYCESKDALHEFGILDNCIPVIGHVMIQLGILVAGTDFVAEIGDDEDKAYACYVLLHSILKSTVVGFKKLKGPLTNAGRNLMNQIKKSLPHDQGLLFCFVLFYVMFVCGIFFVVLFCLVLCYVCLWYF